MRKKIRYGSVCSGIEAASQAWKQLGWECAFVAEIEDFPSDVLKHHYPNVPNYGDMTKYKDWPHHDLDVLVGGTPCQSFSVAGLRQGLSDPRGNLTLTFLGVVDKYKPRYVVWENVPGILSDSTRALDSFFNGLQEVGYAIIGFDILDAQWFGLAQRRRRIFVCAANIQDLLNRKTIFSGLIVLQWLAQIWRDTLGALCGQFSPGHVSYNSESSKHARSLKKKIELFSLQKEEQVSKLLQCLDVLQRLSECAPESSVFDHGSNSRPSKNTPDTKSSAIGKKEPTTQTANQNTKESKNTDTSWKRILEESLRIANASITSIATSETIDSRIFSCAQATLSISKFMLGLNPSLPNYSHAAASCLTALKGFTNYARLTSTDLFGGMGGIRGWADFSREAERTENTLGSIGRECFGEILPLSESLRGDPAPRREKGKRIAANAEGSTGIGGVAKSLRSSDGGISREDSDTVIPIQEIGKRQSGTSMNGVGHGAPGDPMYTLRAAAVHGVAMDAGIPEVCGTLSDGAHMGGGLNGQDAYTGRIIPAIAHALRGEGFDASEDGTGRGTPLVPTIGFSSKDSGNDAQEEIAPTLRSGNEVDGNANGGVAPAIAFEPRNRGDDGRGYDRPPNTFEEQSPALNTVKTPAVAFQSRIARNGRGKPEEIAPALNGSNAGETSDSRPSVIQAMSVRRLTPQECEILQGFPPGYTKINAKTADGPRYRALGNSMAVPVMSWLGRRIELVDQITEGGDNA